MIPLRARRLRTYAIYRSPDDMYYATDGSCTHEHALLADGLVMDHIIECPKHNGRFDYRTGEGKGAPIRVNLRTYPDQGRARRRQHRRRPAVAQRLVVGQHAAVRPTARDGQTLYGARIEKITRSTPAAA